MCASTEDESDEKKGRFYKDLGRVFDHFPK